MILSNNSLNKIKYNVSDQVRNQVSYPVMYRVYTQLQIIIWNQMLGRAGNPLHINIWR
jgi:hypothetical protein